MNGKRCSAANDAMRDLGNAASNILLCAHAYEKALSAPICAQFDDLQLALVPRTNGHGSAA